MFYSYKYPFDKQMLGWRMHNSAKKYGLFDFIGSPPGIYYRLRGPFLTAFSRDNKRAIRFEAIVFSTKSGCSMIGIFGVPFYKVLPFIFVMMIGWPFSFIIKTLSLFIPFSFLCNIVLGWLASGEAKDQAIEWLDSGLGAEKKQ